MIFDTFQKRQTIDLTSLLFLSYDRDISTWVLLYQCNARSRVFIRLFCFDFCRVSASAEGQGARVTGGRGVGVCEVLGTAQTEWSSADHPSPRRWPQGPVPPPPPPTKRLDERRRVVYSCDVTSSAHCLDPSCRTRQCASRKVGRNGDITSVSFGLCAARKVTWTAAVQNPNGSARVYNWAIVSAIVTRTFPAVLVPTAFWQQTYQDKQQHSVRRQHRALAPFADRRLPHELPPNGSRTQRHRTNTNVRTTVARPPWWPR